MLYRAKLLSKINISGTLELMGYKFKVPLSGGVGLHNIYEKEDWMTDVLNQSYAFTQGVFLDIGVNLGQTLMKVKACCPAMKYVGFEPNPVCVAYVKELMKANGFINDQLIPIGLANETGIQLLNFFNTGATDSSASIVENFRADQTDRREWVPCFSFDSISKSIGISNIGIIKIDVEGAESYVLQGMKETLMREQPLLLLEVLPIYSIENTERMKKQHAIEQLMTELNYRIFRIKKNKNLFSSYEPLNHIGVHSNIDDVDYLLVPFSKINKFNLH